jgi:protein-S-isoprenylcysteine O-methyltransferase Ste14
VALAALALPLLLAGIILVVWTTVHQLRFSGGTPAFKAPPRRLLTDGPFALCRNPMILGYLLLYYALAVIFASPSALLLVVPAWNVLAWLVVTRVEEVELRLRFGEAYEEYRLRVGRLLPLWPRRNRPAPAPATSPRSLEFAEETNRARGFGSGP